jgi:hypothetical protein
MKPCYRPYVVIDIYHWVGGRMEKMMLYDILMALMMA